MEDLNQYLLQKLDKISDHIGEIKQSQVRMEVDVQHHIKRTDLLEELVRPMEKRVRVMWAPIDLVGRVLKWLKLLR